MATDWLAWFALAAATLLAGGLLNRHRGGWLGTGHTQLARLDFAIGIAALLYIHSGDWWAFATVPLLWLGCMAPQGWAQGADSTSKDLALYASGIANIAGLAIFAAMNNIPLGIVILAIIPIMKPLAYLLGEAMTGPPVHVFRQALVGGSTEWGEFWWGVSIGFVIVVIGIFV